VQPETAAAVNVKALLSMVPQTPADAPGELQMQCADVTWLLQSESAVQAAPIAFADVCAVQDPVRQTFPGEQSNALVHAPVAPLENHFWHVAPEVPIQSKDPSQYGYVAIVHDAPS